jgi:penicillin-binding protein 1A
MPSNDHEPRRRIGSALGDATSASTGAEREAAPEHRAAPSALLQIGRVLGWAGSAMGACVLLVLLLLGLALAVAYPRLPEIGSLTDYRPKLPLRVFSADGVQIGEFGEERRNFVPIGQIPQIMKDAVLAAEDVRFYQHGGVDYKGVARAALENLRDARSQGASTITMQVARNFYLSTEKTFTRKIYEVLLALKIESQLSKDQILELYMNQIFLGQRANGFAAAAEVYFGKKLTEISIAEAAMLAGLPKAPSAYNPITNPKRATQRQRYIVNRLFETGFITEAQHDQALAEELKYYEASNDSQHAEYVAETARALVFAQYGEETYSRGLNVVVTVRMSDQLVSYRALRKGVMDYELRQVYRGPEAFVDLPAQKALVEARVSEALADHPDNDDVRAAVVLEVSPGKVVAMLQDGAAVTVAGSGLRPVISGLSDKAAPKVRIRRGAVVRTWKNAKGEWILTQLPEVEGALVTLDPRNGAVRSLVGGFDFTANKFNHVTQAWRQPGSSFKPFIYSAALEKGLTALTQVNDAPLFFDAAATGSQPWEPKNYDGHFDGPMSLLTGLARSKNMVSIRVLQAAGPPFVQSWLSAFGFDLEKNPPYLTMALGAGSATPMQMVQAYSVFANGGYRVTPQLIARITDSKGRALFEMPGAVPDESARSLSARNAFVMGTFLQEVTKTGTAARVQAVLKRSDIYGKTGTTNDSMDSWFAGYHPSLAAVVWMGYDTPRKLGEKETGATLALPIWLDVMQTQLRGLPVVQAVAPPGVVNVGGGRWVFEEFTNGRGVTGLGLNDPMPEATPPPSTEEERTGILDLFKR